MSSVRISDVIVITGGSSGIGAAAAIEFAKRGASLCLVARSQERLEQVVESCRALGADCIAVVGDVAQADLAAKVASAALGAWGRIDVWVNNAGHCAIGSFTEIPVAEHAKVIETNLLGSLYGAHAALNVFIAQGRGTLINNASVCSNLAPPNLASYNASKYGIRGLSHSLRQDLALAKVRNIHICQVNPSLVDTQIFARSNKFSSRPVDIRFPLLTPLAVARVIVKLARHPKREVSVGSLGRLGIIAYVLMPRLTGWIIVQGMRRFFFTSSHKLK